MKPERSGNGIVWGRGNRAGGRIGNEATNVQMAWNGIKTTAKTESFVKRAH
jgi:hypothetical protein